MTTAELVLRYLEVLVSWPAVGLVLGLFGLKWFREPLAGFLSRMTKGEAYGVRLEARNPSEQLKSKKPPQLESAEKITEGPTDKLEEYIRENPKEVLAIQLRLANGYRFERSFNLIFGTQVDLLVHLSERHDEGDLYINLFRFYNEYTRRSFVAPMQMADYLNFLRSAGYIELVGEGIELRAKITPFGVDFLSYLRTSYPTSYRGKAL
jgi:hypothetical protein